MKTTLLLLLVGGLAPAATWIYEIHPAAQTLMELTVEKTGLLSGKKHLFTFSRFQGVLEFDADVLEQSTITLWIESASASCHDTWLSAKDLRKVQEYALTDMLAADRYPRITFRSSAINKIDANRYEVRGTLTIREASKPAVITVSLRAESGGLPVMEGVSRIRLTDFGFKPPTAALGTIGTKNEMLFRFFVTPTKRGKSSGAAE